MDPLQTRLDALEQHVHTLQQQTHTVTRRLRWWRGLACGLVGLAVLAWMLPAVIAQEDAADKGRQGLAQRVAALESLLKHVSREGNDVTLTGANLHIINGLGSTTCFDEEGEIPDCPNGLGNLIVGYNEVRFGCSPDPCVNTRTGSHNVVMGQFNNFSRVGGLVVGDFNEISGDFAVVIGGIDNTASGEHAVVSGGQVNTASGGFAVVSGGGGNTASGAHAVVSGGQSNTASEFRSVVSGGEANTASGVRSVVSGGRNITQETEAGWSAGSEADEVVVGNFRSP